jgi:hypothetical protein
MTLFLSNLQWASDAIYSEMKSKMKSSLTARRTISHTSVAFKDSRQTHEIEHQGRLAPRTEFQLGSDTTTIQATQKPRLRRKHAYAVSRGVATMFSVFFI